MYQQAVHLSILPPLEIEFNIKQMAFLNNVILKIAVELKKVKKAN